MLLMRPKSSSLFSSFAKLLLFSLLLLSPILRGQEEKLRIVSLSPAITEILCLLGGEKFLVGRCSSCNYPESVKKIPVAGGFAQPDMEKILSLRPTHLLSNDLINPVAAKRFSSLGIQCMTKQASRKEDYFFWVELIGKLLSKEKEASSEIDRVEKILGDLEKKTHLIPEKERKRVLWIIWDSPLMAAGKNSLPDSIIRYAGGKNIAENVKSDYFKCSPEWVERSAPDIIVFLDLPPKKRKELSSRYPWNALKAWKEGRIVSEIPEDLLLRPGPRFTEGVLLLNRALYP